MSDDTDTTRWSLPGQTDVPRDELKIQLEVYDETILLRGFEGGANWVRTVSADAIANAFTQHLGLSTGILPKETLWWNQSETGQVVALWRPPKVWPVALQREAFKPPARLRVPMPGLLFVCSPGRAPWVYAAKSRPTGAEQQLYRAPAFNVFGDGRVCPGSHRFPEEVGMIPDSFFQSFFSMTGDTRDRSKKHPDNLHALWEELDGKRKYPLRTWFPNARWPRLWRSPKGDRATTREVPRPVGYLINHPAGLTGGQGIGYDYVLGAGGLYVQSRSAHLAVRVLVAPGSVRGLAPVSEKLTLPHGPIPVYLFEVGLRWFQETPSTERFFAVRWDGAAYRLVVPEQAGTASSLTYRPPAGVVAEFHSHGKTSAFFSGTDDRDEQGFRIYGVVGKLDTSRPELSLRMGVYGHFGPLRWGQVFAGPNPGVRLLAEEPESP